MLARRIFAKAVHLCRGPCAACSCRGGAPLCTDCSAASAIASRPYEAEIDGDPLLFRGAYRDSAHHLTPLGRSLHAFKDSGNRYAGRCLAALFADGLGASAACFDAVVPVPADPARLRARGLSPACWLARALAGRAATRLVTTALTRRPGLLPQRGLGGDERRTNVRDAFELGAARVRGYAVLVVDDVVTTGATLRAAAARLHDAGAAETAFAVLACADENTILQCRCRTANDGN